MQGVDGLGELCWVDGVCEEGVGEEEDGDVLVGGLGDGCYEVLGVFEVVFGCWKGESASYADR